MKRKITRILALCLSLGLCIATLALSGCNMQKGGRVTLDGPPTTFTLKSIRGEMSVEHPLPEEAGQEILRYLENKCWQDGAGKCETNYLLNAGSTSLAYSSDCGTVIDKENNRSFTFSEEEQEAINALLHVGYSATPTPYPSIDRTGDSVTIYYCLPFYRDISTKTVYGSLATELKAHLANAPETGETEPALTEDTAVLPPRQQMLEQHLSGIFWIQADETLYRSGKKLSLVGSYAGEGTILEETDAFRDLLHDLWYYYPSDYYTGTYNLASDEWKIEHAFEADTSVRFQIEEFKMGKEEGDPCTLVLTVFSDLEQVFYFDYKYWSGSDVYVGSDSCRTYSNGTDPVTVRINFKMNPLFGSRIDLNMGQSQTIVTIYIRK